MTPPTLRSQLLIATTCVFIVVTAALTVLARWITIDVVEDETARIGQRSASLLSSAIGPMLAIGDLGSVNELADELVRNREFSFVRVLDTSGRVVATARTEDTSTSQSFESSLRVGERVYGEIQFGIDRVFVLAAANRVFWTLLSVCCLVLLVGGLTLVYFTRVLTDQLDALRDATERMASGETDITVKICGTNELGHLAGCFNTMAKALNDRLDALKTAEKVLEERVAVRTQELSESNKSLLRALDDRKQLQDELVQQEKLASLGALVAGISHELNTPIGNALLMATTMEDEALEFSTVIKSGLRKAVLEKHLQLVNDGAKLITKNLNRASELIASFKHVAADQTSGQRRSFVLGVVMKEVVDTLRPSFKKKPYSLEIDVPDQIILESYPGPLGQVVINLVNNALLHAFENRSHGKIRIRATPEADDKVRIIFSDDGIGISQENIKHIFDPFFTTRLGKGGSGLGLHIVYNTVTRVLGGKISVHAVIGQGTDVIVILPLVAPLENPASD